MLFIPLLRKEVHWSKRNLVVLGFLLLLVPVAFGMTSVAFQETVPENVPVATVPQNENVTESDIGNVEAILTVYTDPVRVASEGDPASNREKAVRMMEREEVYAIVEVPPNVDDAGPDTNETFSFVIDGNIAPLQDALPFIEDLVQGELADGSESLGGEFNFETEIIGTDRLGEERSLAEFLFPTFMMAMLIFFAFTYVPYSLARDGSVLDRLRVETSIESLVAAKLVFLTALMVVPLLMFGGLASYLEYDIGALSPLPLALMLLTFSSLASIAMAVMVASRFGGTGQFVNLLLMLGVLGVSAIDFPRGVVSATRPGIAELLPTHWGMVATRSLMLKDVPVGMYTDMILSLVGLQVLGLIALKGSIVYYRRTT
jgi:ABC-2 type transport system permease protein